MEVITEMITLQMIFSKYWEAFKKWHNRKIKEAVIFNVSDPLICKKCHVEMEFWFARYTPDLRVLKHFGIGESDRIPSKQLGAPLRCIARHAPVYIRISINDEY